MKKFNITIVVLFSLFLLVPFGGQTICDLKGEKRFVSFDLFKDVFYSPFAREFSLNKGAKNLKESWVKARENIAAGNEASFENVVVALSDLEASAFTINSSFSLDSTECDYKILKQADTLLNALEEDPENFEATDLALKNVIKNFENFSLKRVAYSVKKYGAWNGKYLRAFEKKVENENALVLAARPLYQLAVWNIFNDPGEKVVLGANCISDCGNRPGRFLYYRQDVEFLVQPSPLNSREKKLDNPLLAITKFRDQLKQKGIELLVVIVPGKPSIYPERLTGYAPHSVGGHGKDFLDTLNSLGFMTVDLYNPLWNAKVNDSYENPLYLDDDTHWTPRGAEIAANAIAQKVKELENNGIIVLGENKADYEIVDSIANRMGDIGEMSGLNTHGIFKPQQVTGHVVYEIKDSIKVPFKDDFRKSTILILGDSFSRIYQTDSPVNAGWIAHFAKLVNRPVSSIVSDGGASTLVREKLARKANVLKGKKLLIWEFVERDLRFGAEGWKTIEF